MLALRQLQDRLGPGTWVHSHNGWHMRVGSPALLDKNGMLEVYERHLAINVDKLALLNAPKQWTRTNGPKVATKMVWIHGKAVPDLTGSQAGNSPWIAFCNKTQQPYSIYTLLTTPLLTTRLKLNREELAKKLPEPSIEELEEMEVYCQRSLFKTQKGDLDWIPKPPGCLIPASQMPQDCPGRLWLEHRGFHDVEALERHVGLAWCPWARADYPVRQSKFGFPVTPAGRLIFQMHRSPGLMTQRGCRTLDPAQTECFNWQAALLVRRFPDYADVWNPETETWEVVGDLTTDEGKEAFDEWLKAARKYLFPRRSQSNQTLFGYAESVACDLKDRFGNRVCFLTEGVLDAARLGPPAVALGGKFLAHDKCVLLREKFGRLILVPDADDPGQQAIPQVWLNVKKYGAMPDGRKLLFSVAPPPKSLRTGLPYKDAAEIPAAEVAAFRQHYLDNYDPDYADQIHIP